MQRESVFGEGDRREEEERKGGRACMKWAEKWKGWVGERRIRGSCEVRSGGQGSGTIKFSNTLLIKPSL